MATAALPLQSARPSVRIEGQEAGDLDGALLDMQVAERTDGMARAELVFGAFGLVSGQPGYTLFDRRRLEFGKRIEVRLGDAPVFAGRILALEGRFPARGTGEPQLAVFAEDALQDLRMTRRSRTFEQVSDADLARRIAQDHGLQAQAEAPGPTHAVLAQVNQSDLAFLRERARAVAAEVWIDDRGLHFATRPSRARGQPVALAYGSNLHRFDVRADLALQRSRVTASGWSVADKRAVSESAEASLLDAELEGGDGGPHLLRQRVGDRADTVAHLLPGDAAEARAIAEATLRQLGRRFVCGRGVAAANAALRVGAAVQLDGLGPLFDGRYVVTALCHRFDTRQGQRTEFEVERPSIGRP